MNFGDAFDRMAELRTSTQHLVNDYIQETQRGSSALLLKTLLAFELRWKLEDLVLIPALKDTQGVMSCGTRDAERELSALRDLAGLAREEGLGLARQRVLLSAIETLAELRSQRVASALTRAQRAALIDTRALALEMDQLLEQLCGECRRTGNIEDEEMVRSVSRGDETQAQTRPKRTPRKPWTNSSRRSVTAPSNPLATA